MELNVYNLQFPDYVEEFDIHGYKFRRVANYKEQLGKLQHVEPIDGEFRIERKNGGSAHTATVTVPKDNLKDKKNRSFEPVGLREILLLLSLFTRRDVCTERDIQNNCYTLSQWPRGKLLVESLSNAYLQDENNKGFEKRLNEIYSITSSEEWKSKYVNGFFIGILKAALTVRDLGASYILCFTVWDHLFALHCEQRMSGKDKLSFLFKEYELHKYLGEDSSNMCDAFARVRNGLVHDGKLPPKYHSDDVEFFIYLTQSLVAKVLGLKPTDIYKYKDTFKDRIKKISKG